MNIERELKSISALVKNSLFKHSEARDRVHLTNTYNKDINHRQVNPFTFFSVNNRLMPSPKIKHKMELLKKLAKELELRRKRDLKIDYERKLELDQRYIPKLRR